jgi:diguanylate cyclase (GGDEF)-like protein
MKNHVSFAQLQVRIFILLLLSFSFAVIGYRLFIERPQLESSINQNIRQQLSSLALAGKNELEKISTINYDYAVWDDTYKFITSVNSDYIESNLGADTFISLKIDGMFFVDEKNNILLKKGFNHKTHKEIDYSFLNIKNIKKYQPLAPINNENNNVPVMKGLVQTDFGPALFSSTMIKRSNKTGNDHGFLMFIKLFDQDLINELAKFTFTDVHYEPISQSELSEATTDWLDMSSDITISDKTELFLHDYWNKPIGKLAVMHPNGVVPSWLDWQSILFILLLMSILLIIYSIFSLKVTYPINALASQIKKMSTYNYDDSRHKLRQIDKLGQITEILIVIDHLNKLIDRINLQNEKLNQHVYLDPLTNIANRRALLLHLDKKLPYFIRFNVDFMIIMIDIDNFKKYNDLYGHVAGDAVLVKVAGHLESFFKRKTDICARYGGEEFIVICAIGSKDKSESIIAGIINSFKNLNIKHEKSDVRPFITVSMGVCKIKNSLIKNKKNDIAIENLISKADSALYQAKNNGKNQAVVINYSQDTND